MAQPQPQEQSLYGLPVPVTKAPTPPVIAKRDPVPSDTGYPLSQLWINNVLGSAWILTQVQGGLATWIPILGAGAGVQTIGGFLPIASNFNFVNLGGLTIGGAAGQFSAGVNVTGPVLSIVANSIEAQVSSASPVSNPLLNGVSHFDSAQFSVDGNGFVQLAGGGIAVDQIAVQATTAPGVSPVDPDGAGLLTINGASVAASSVPVQSRSIALNSLQIEVQRASAQAVSAAADAGLASFDSTQFTVDANGFVQLAGGGVAIDQIAVDAFTGPGTNPVDPTAGGLVTITGGQIAAGTTANVIRSHSTALNSLTIEVQRASASAVSNVAVNGVAHFDSAQFSVDASGWVQMANGLPVAGIDVQASTPPGTDPVLPNGSGIIAVSGAQVAAAGIPIQTNSIAANSYEIQVQRSSAQAVPTLSANGICHFNSGQFSVDADGFVSSLVGSAPWLDSAGGALANHTGYFATAAAAYTLPAGAVNGDMVEIVDFIGGGVVVTAQGGDLIRIGNVDSSVNGTATSTQLGDSIRAVYRAVGQVWVACPGVSGNWVLA